jgi:ADP-heptose:LPS heptosyltransferase
VILPESELAAHRIERILVVRLSSLGDVVLATPALRAIRAGFPAAEIVVAVERRFAALLRRNPRIDRLIEAESGPAGTLRALLESRRALRAEPRFDLAIDLQGLRRSAIWVYASRARLRAGRGRPRPFWHCAITPDLRRHAVLVGAELLERIGIPVGDPDPELEIDPSADARLVRMLAGAGLAERGFVVVHPCSRWRSKDWPAERWGALVEWLTAERRVPVVVSGGPGEETIGRRIAASGAVSLAGALALDESLCLFRRARFLVCGDTGPMHAAAALGTRVVALFGPTLPERTGPWGLGHEIVHERRPEGAPVYREDRAGVFIRAIGVDRVRRAVDRALDATARSG